jgi:hypothetical protein
VKEKIWEKAVKLDQNSCGDGEPYRRKYWGSGKKLFHGSEPLAGDGGFCV